MSHNRLISLLLTAALIAQTVIAGWGHSHAHLSDELHNDSKGVAIHSHHHHHGAGDHYYANGHTRDGSHEHPSLPSEPTSQDDCTVCRHLALAAIFTFDLEVISVDLAADAVPIGEPLFVSNSAIGLHRPRSPPELS